MDFRRHVLTGKATTLRRESYVSPEVFAAKREKIFARQWLCLGRADRAFRPRRCRAGNPGRCLRTRRSGPRGATATAPIEPDSKKRSETFDQVVPASTDFQRPPDVPR
jgi:hypothetical protein